MKYFALAAIPVLVMQVALAQPYQCVYPSYDPISYSGIFDLGGHIYRVGYMNLIEISNDRGVSWNSLTPSKRLFNFVRVSASGSHAVALISPMREALDDWDDSTNTSIMLFVQGAPNPVLLKVPCSLPANGATTYVDCDAAQDAIFVLQRRGDDMTVVRSLDNGQSWLRIPLPDSLPRIQYLDFYNMHRGILITSNPEARGYLSVYRTIDGGASWSETEMKMRAVDGLTPWEEPCVQWLSADSIMAVDYDNAIRLSADGGASWMTQYNDLSIPIIKGISMKNNGQGVFVCDDGRVLRTNDHGTTLIVVHGTRFAEGHLSSNILYGDGGSIYLVDGIGQIARSSDAGVSWLDEKVQELYPKSSRVQMLSEDSVYCRMYPTNETSRGTYYRTTDGGSSWEPVYKLDHDAHDLYYIHFATGMVWYGFRPASTNDSTILMRTTDAGNTWESIYKSAHETEFNSLWTGDYSLGEKTFWCVFPGGITKTEDGGKHWSTVSVDMPLSWSGSIDLSNPPLCYILSNQGYSRSTDNGNSWRRADDSLRKWNSVKLLRADENIMYQHIRKSDLGYLLLKSTDSGTTWDSITVIQNWNFKIGYIDTNGNGSGIQSNSSETYISTKNEWRSYEIQGERYRYGPSDISFLDSKTGWVTSYLALYKTTNGGISWTDVTPSVAQSPRILSTWPQPVSQGGMMSTEVELTRPGPVRIELYDLLGRRRAVVLDTEVNATRRIVQWSTIGLERGVYVLRMVTGDSVASGKVVVN